jgi:hypothetical protein
METFLSREKREGEVSRRVLRCGVFQYGGQKEKGAKFVEEEKISRWHCPLATTSC